MHEEEFGYAYDTLKRVTIPALEARGFQASAALDTSGPTPRLAATVRTRHEGVEVIRTTTWSEGSDGRVAHSNMVSLALTDLPADHPNNKLLAGMFEKESRLLSMKAMSIADTAILRIGTNVDPAYSPELHPNFADNIEYGLQEYVSKAEPGALRATAESALQLLSLANRAATLGLVVSPHSTDRKQVSFRRKTSYEDCLSLQIELKSGTLKVEDALVTLNDKLSNITHYSNKLSAPLTPEDTLDSAFDKGWALASNGSNSRERVLNYILSLADALKDKGYDVSTKVEPSTGESMHTQEVEIGLSEQKGDVVLKTRHIFKVYELGHAEKEVLPSVRFANLPSDHKTNLALAKFDEMSTLSAKHLLWNLTQAKLVPAEGNRGFPTKFGTDESFAHLPNVVTNIEHVHRRTRDAEAPVWARTLADFMLAREAAVECGFLNTGNVKTEKERSVSFMHSIKTDNPENPANALWQNFNVSVHPDGGIKVLSTNTETYYGYSRMGLARGYPEKQPYLATLEEAVRAACPEALSKVDKLVAESLNNYVSNNIGECWLESVDLQKGTAQVGIMSQWADRKLHLVEVAFKDNVATGLTQDFSVATLPLMTKDISEVGVARYGPIAEKHILESITPYFAALEKVAASLKMSDVRLTPNLKSILVTVEDTVQGARKEVKLDIKQSGGQVLLTRAEGTKPRRPFHSVAGVRALELLLAPLAGQLLEQERQKNPAPAKKRAPAKTAGVER